MSEKLIKVLSTISSEEQKLLEMVDKNSDKLIELVQNLVRIDSRTYENQYSDQSKIYEFVENYMKESGLKIKKYAAHHNYDENESRTWPNLIAVLDGAEEGKTIQFNGHLDIVPFNEEKWRDGIEPLSGLVKEGKIYGRGTNDMKGGVACGMMAMKILQESNIPLKGRAQMWFSPDEEIDARYGARYMVKNHFDDVNADATIIGEPTGQSPIQSPAVVVGEKGIQWFKLTFHGAAGHGSMPKAKSNALNKATKFMSSVKKLKLPKVKPPFSMKDLASAILSRYKISALIKAISAPSDDEPDPHDEDGLSLAPFFKTTISFNQIHAGSKVNVIPDKCELSIDIRVLPGITTQNVLDSFAKYCTKLGYRIEFPDGYDNLQHDNQKIQKRPVDIDLEIYSSHLGTFENPESEICQTLSDSFEQVYNTKTVFFFAPGGTDATHMRNAGMKHVVIFGPAGRNSHDANEFVFVEHLISVTKIYLLTAYRMLNQ